MDTKVSQSNVFWDMPNVRQDMIDMVACMVRRRFGLRCTRSHLTVFHYTATPSISIDNYIKRVYKYLPEASVESMFLTLIVLDRIHSQHPTLLSCYTIHRMFLAACYDAIKFADDDHYRPEDVAPIGGVSMVQLYDYEVAFLKLVGWNLCYTDKELALAHRHLCCPQTHQSCCAAHIYRDMTLGQKPITTSIAISMNPSLSSSPSFSSLSSSPMSNSLPISNTSSLSCSLSSLLPLPVSLLTPSYTSSISSSISSLQPPLLLSFSFSSPLPLPESLPPPSYTSSQLSIASSSLSSSLSSSTSPPPPLYSESISPHQQFILPTYISVFPCVDSSKLMNIRDLSVPWQQSGNCDLIRQLASLSGLVSLRILPHTNNLGLIGRKWCDSATRTNKTIRDVHRFLQHLERLDMVNDNLVTDFTDGNDGNDKNDGNDGGGDGSTVSKLSHLTVSGNVVSTLFETTERLFPKLTCDFRGIQHVLCHSGSLSTHHKLSLQHKWAFDATFYSC